MSDGLGVTIVKGSPSPETFAAMDKATNAWMGRAARLECGWVCPDCCISHPGGMPSTCACGHADCDRLLLRDIKAWAPERYAALNIEVKDDQG